MLRVNKEWSDQQLAVRKTGKERKKYGIFDLPRAERAKSLVRRKPFNFDEWTDSA
tara:strand:- start:31 stop:195 length:165 start_codon:yes stop_codon:yes gene_type:complete